MTRPKKTEAPLDRELVDLPAELRWRTWMGRVEAVIFVSAKPVPREVLARVVGEGCRLDELLADIREDLRSRPYELAAVAGGFRLQTRTSVADAIRASGVTGAEKPELSQYEMTVLAAVAYFQPITRAELGRFTGREVSRDTIGSLRRAGVLGAGPRAPLPGAPATYVTTPAFLSAFGFDTLRDLPEIEALEDAGLLGEDRAVADELPSFSEGNGEPDDDPPDLAAAELWVREAG